MSRRQIRAESCANFNQSRSSVAVVGNGNVIARPFILCCSPFIVPVLCGTLVVFMLG